MITDSKEIFKLITEYNHLQHKLVRAIYHKDINKVKEAIGEGADANIEFNHDHTPLWIAFDMYYPWYPGIFEILKILIEAGGDVNSTNRSGRKMLTLLQIQVRDRDLRPELRKAYNKVIKYLREKGATE